MATPPRKNHEGGALIADFDRLLETSPPPPCSCRSSALRRVIWALKMVDIIRLARRFRDPVVVAVEYRQQGSRLFMVTSRRHVYHHLCYLRLHRPQFQTWHEIFSGLTPLRLYFDLDFYYATNPGIDANRILSEFRGSIIEMLSEHFHWELGEEKNLKLTDLDATTQEKFSRHMIIRMINSDGNEQVLFKNSLEIREFVHQRLLPRLKSDGLFVNPKPSISASDPSPIVDLSVYSEKPGQNFRLLGSPKFGRQNYLRLLHDPQTSSYADHEIGFHDSQCQICENVFLVSLVTMSNATRKRQNQSSTAEPQLISEKNLDSYIRETNGISIDTDFFGVRATFYYEMQQFGQLSKLFYAKLCRDLFNDIREMSRKSQFYENLPPDSDLNRCVQVCLNFKREMARNPIDWDSIYGYAGDIFDFFQANTPRDDFDQLDAEAELGPEIDPNSIRRLRLLYSKFSKWRQENPAHFFSHDFEKAKKMYDSYLENILASKKTILPNHIPGILTRDHFQEVYDSLEKLETCELERRKIKKQKYEHRFAVRAEKLRRCFQDEDKFRRWVENRFDEYKSKNGNVDSVQKSVALAIAHSVQLMKEFETRIRIAESGNVQAEGACAGSPSINAASVVGDQ